MKRTIGLIAVALLAAACSQQAVPEAETLMQAAEAKPVSPAEYHAQKPAGELFVIERDMPGVGDLTPDELREGSKTSNAVLSDLGPDIQWIHSYVTDDKIYCVYRAPSEELIRKHAELSGFPATNIARAGAIIDPTTGGE
jgi:hypothetical protein